MNAGLVLAYGMLIFPLTDRGSLLRKLWFVALCFAVLTGCGSLQQSQPPLPPCGGLAVPCYARVQLDVGIKPERFSAEDVQAIHDGAAMWEAATQGAVLLRFVPLDEAQVVVQEGALPTEPIVEWGFTHGCCEVTIDRPRVTDAIGVAGVVAHEFGHVMGLRHSTDDRALMAALVHAPMVVTDDDLRALYEVLPQ